MEEIKSMLREVLKEELFPVHHKLGQLDQRIDGLETKFDGFEQRLSGLEIKFDGFEERFNGLETQFDGFEKRFSSLETKFNGFEERFNELETSFDGFQEQMSHMKIQLDHMQIQLDRIEHAQNDDVIGHLRMLNTKAVQRLDQHENRIDLLNERLHHTEAEVRQLQKQL